MSNKLGWYYLHCNGNMIYKADPNANIYFDKGGFVVKYWPWTGIMDDAIRMLQDAINNGANKNEIIRLCQSWKVKEQSILEI